MKHLKPTVILLLVFLTVLGSVSAQTSDTVKEVGFLDKLLLLLNPEVFAVSFSDNNPDPNELITYKGLGTVPSSGDCPKLLKSLVSFYYLWHFIMLPFL